MVARPYNIEIVPFVIDGGRLRGIDDGHRIAATRLVETRTVVTECCTAPAEIDVFQLDASGPGGEAVLVIDGAPVITTVRFIHRIEDRLFDAAYRRLGELNTPLARQRTGKAQIDLYEIWHAAHAETAGIHLPDCWGEPTELLEALHRDLVASGAALTRPAHNHDKLSSKRRDMTALDELHFDGLHGIDSDDHGRRRLVWRYLLNLGTAPRFTAFAPNRPSAAERHVPIAWSATVYDAFFAAANRRLPYVVAEIPGRDVAGGAIYGLRLPTSHVLHGEYGFAGDYLGVLHSLA